MRMLYAGKPLPLESPMRPLYRSERAAGAIVLLAALGLAGCYREFEWQRREADVRTERLCAEAADPDHAPDTTFLDCAMEGDGFAPPAPAAKREIVVLAYNIERGFGQREQLDLLLHDPGVPTPDVLLLSEVDRGCRRTQFRNVAREYAQAFGYYYVYATEFVELPGSRGESGLYDPPLCEHGNAIVSRWPLANVRQIRFAQNRSWYTSVGFPNPDEPRLGGRVAIAADLRVGDRLLRLYALHLESNPPLSVRDAQVREVLDDAQGVFYPVVVGGDLNTYEMAFALYGGFEDQNMRAFREAGFLDAHAGLSLADRYTAIDQLPLVIDLIYARGAKTLAPGVCPGSRCDPLSDHRPVWASVALACDAPDPDCDGVADPADNCPQWWNPEQADAAGDGVGDACQSLAGG